MDTYQTVKLTNDGTRPFKHFVGIHPYHSNAWSYTNDTFVAPVSTNKKIYIENEKALGNSRITLKVIGYKWLRMRQKLINCLSYLKFSRSFCRGHSQTFPHLFRSLKTTAVRTGMFSSTPLFSSPFRSVIFHKTFTLKFFNTPWKCFR